MRPANSNTRIRIEPSFDVEQFKVAFEEYAAGFKPTHILLFKLLDHVRPVISRAIRDGASPAEIANGLKAFGLKISARKVKLYVDSRIRKIVAIDRHRMKAPDSSEPVSPAPQAVEEQTPIGREKVEVIKL